MNLYNDYFLLLLKQFELLHNLENNGNLTQLESMPQLRLSPPALYHEKVKKGKGILTEESTSRVTEKPTSKQLRDVKVKGSSRRFPLKSNIFGKLIYGVSQTTLWFPRLIQTDFMSFCRQGKDQ